MAVLIPVTFGMNPQTAMCLLIGIYVSACYGGSIPSILLKIPGTASSVVTAFDGQPMTLNGQAGLALSISTTSSVFGGILSSIVLLFFSPFLAAQALKFGPPEYLMLAVMGMSTVIGMAGKAMLKNIMVMSLGLLISCIGLSPQAGFARLTLGSPYLLEGIPLVPMLIGLFGVSSILEKNYLQSMVLSNNSWSIFVTRPISLGLLIVSLLFVAVPLYKRYLSPKRAKAANH